MNLSDPEILELNDLCNALLDNTISDTQKARLSQWLSTSDEARRFYVRVMGQSASLCHYASEMQTGEPDANSDRMKIGRRFRWVIGLLSIAGSLALIVWMARPKHLDQTAQAPTTNENEFVAKLTGSKETLWANNISPAQPDGRFIKGQKLELIKGFAELTFDSGAQVLLQGPAS